MKSADLLLLAYRTFKKGEADIAKRIFAEALSDASAPFLMESIYKLSKKTKGELDDGTVDNNNSTDVEDADVDGDFELETITDNDSDNDSNTTDNDPDKSDDTEEAQAKDLTETEIEKTNKPLPTTDDQVDGKGEIKKTETMPTTDDQLDGKGEIKKTETMPTTDNQLDGKEIVKKTETLPTTDEQLGVEIALTDILTDVQLAQLKAIANKISSKTGGKSNLAKQLMSKLLK